jgi:hypothetical protein
MPLLIKAGYVLLFGVGTVVFVFGLLQAAHPPFQCWWYGTRWYTPERKGPVDVNSKEYNTAIIHMTIAGSRAAFIGGVLAIFSLAQLGFLLPRHHHPLQP